MSDTETTITPHDATAEAEAAAKAEAEAAAAAEAQAKLDAEAAAAAQKADQAHQAAVAKAKAKVDKAAAKEAAAKTEKAEAEAETLNELLVEIETRNRPDTHDALVTFLTLEHGAELGDDGLALAGLTVPAAVTLERTLADWCMQARLRLMGQV
jgi:hypothetical protein